MFEEYALPGFVLEAIAEQGWDEPTAIQQQVLPPALAGADILGGAPTGTSKSAAFLLPIIARLAQRPRKGVQCIILEPTRELAQQIVAVAESLLTFQDESMRAGDGEITAKITCGTIIGGADRVKQRESLPTIVGATPGRLQEFLRKGWLNSRDVEILIIDEADRMLDMGFREDIATITRELTSRFQTMLFSATLEGYGVRDFARNVLNKPVEIKVTARTASLASANAASANVASANVASANAASDGANATHDGANAGSNSALSNSVDGESGGSESANALKSAHAPTSIANPEPVAAPEQNLAEREQRLPELLQARAYYAANESQKVKILLHLLTTVQGKSIVFVRTKDNLAKLSAVFKHKGMSFASLMGECSLQERAAALRRFSDGSVSLLLATDVASRGLDIEDVSFVYNYDLPHQGEIYVHRAGRTARAGAKGVVISLVQKDELAILERIERYSGRTIERRAIKGLCATFESLVGGQQSEKKRGRASPFGGFDKKKAEDKKPRKKVRHRDRKNKGKPDFAAKRAKKAARTNAGAAPAEVS